MFLRSGARSPRSFAAAWLAAALALACAAPALAHHSFATFDRSQRVTLNGAVKGYEWTNPHVWLQLEVKDANGQSYEWSIEHGSPNALKRVGWSRNSFKVGDKVTVVINPMKDGSKGGLFVSATLPDGSTLGAK